MPEKCAPEGYSKGCVAFVQVLLMITVYSAVVVGIAGGAGGAAAGAGALFDPFPQATIRRDGIRNTERRARMTASVTWTRCPAERVEYRTPNRFFPARMWHRSAGTTSPVHFETPERRRPRSG